VDHDAVDVDPQVAADGAGGAIQGFGVPIIRRAAAITPSPSHTSAISKRLVGKAVMLAVWRAGGPFGK
jgi:hypothetical protein